MDSSDPFLFSAMPSPAPSLLGSSLLTDVHDESRQKGRARNGTQAQRNHCPHSQGDSVILVFRFAIFRWFQPVVAGGLMTSKYGDKEVQCTHQTPVYCSIDLFHAHTFLVCLWSISKLYCKCNVNLMNWTLAKIIFHKTRASHHIFVDLEPISTLDQSLGSSCCSCIRAALHHVWLV